MDKIEIETFQNIGNYDIANLTQKESSSFNGMVRVTKYKITVEKINEPIEIIHERLEKLWVKSDNWHDSQPLEEAAKKYKYKFKAGFGSQKEKK